MGRAIGGAMMIGGLFTLALFAGITGHSLLHAVLRIQKEPLRMKGDPTKGSELDKMRIAHASTVIVTGSRRIKPQEADPATIPIVTSGTQVLHLDPAPQLERA